MVEVERNAYIRPYQSKIEYLKYNIEESKKIITEISEEERKAEVQKMIQWNSKIKYLESEISKLTFEYQGKKLGTTFIEVASNCPSGWKMTPEESLKWLEEKVFPYYPLKVFKKPDKKEV